MSTAWGLRCVACDENSPCWWNYGVDLARLCVEIWPAVKAIREAAEAREEYRIDVQDLVRCDDAPHVFDFLAQHFEHGALVVRNEYGDTEPLGSGGKP